MKLLNRILLIVMAAASFNLYASEVVLVGNLPDRYVDTAKDKQYALGYIHIKDRLIQSIAAIKSKKALDSVIKKNKTAQVVYLNSTGKYSKSAKHDFIFPGMIDLHNHTKQNVLGVWADAQGQFANRFEWRKWNNYKYSVSGNMNPWIGYGKPIECAAFRWSEIQAMTLGTVYLQGPSSCIKNYLIHQVEDTASYISPKLKVQAPTDLVLPSDMTYVWQVLRPMIESGMTYEAALAKDINANCDLPNITEKTVNEKDTLKILKNKELLVEKCTKKETLHKKFIRYVYWIHSTIAGRKKYLADKNHAAIIAHLAEGRRDDYYNQREFDMVKLLGLVKPYVNFVHGVGIDKTGLETMGKNQMGLIWSPYSNLLLYGQTLDIKTARDVGVMLSLGSDWQPTGAKGLLEELKIAADYIDRDPAKEGLKKIFTDEEVFKMVTENPAKMINHWEIDAAKKEHGIGRLVKGAMGSVIVTTNLDENPYTSLVRKTWARDLNLVVVDGKVIYGNTDYLAQADITKNQYEVLPMYSFGSVELQKNDKVPVLPEAGATKQSKADHLVTLGKFAKSYTFNFKDQCEFKKVKGLVHQDSLAQDERIVAFKEKTGINLDRMEDIQRLLMTGLLTQSRNMNNPQKGKKSFAIQTFPPMFSCHEQSYLDRLTNFVDPDNKDAEFVKNRDPANRDDRRKTQRLGNTPKKMAEDYAK